MFKLATLLPAAALLAASLPLGGLLASTPQEQADSVAILFPPWIKPAARLKMVAQADAELVRAGALPLIWLVRSDQPDLPRRLRKAGMLLLLNVEAASGCMADE